jgi:hypothetical protein
VCSRRAEKCFKGQEVDVVWPCEEVEVVWPYVEVEDGAQHFSTYNSTPITDTNKIIEFFNTIIQRLYKHKFPRATSKNITQILQERSPLSSKSAPT